MKRIRLCNEDIHMPIQGLKIDHVLAFQNLDLPFNQRINVVISENRSGKTAILKMIYSAAQSSQNNVYRQKRHLWNYFSDRNHDPGQYVNQSDGNDEGFYRVSDGIHFYSETYSSADNEIRDDSDSEWFSLNIPSVYIPATEMLSHVNGFLGLNQKYQMHFDATETDIVVNASLPEASSLPSYMNEVLVKTSQVIDGTVIQENDTFYVIKNDGMKGDFSLEAEGLRKLGLLWKLIRNGLLERGSVLLWDEPEANLNPELYPLVSEILLTLAENGVQIFVTTHSYNFSKYLEIRRKEKDEVSFVNLFRNEAGQIESQSAQYPEDLKPNHMMTADESLLDEVYRKETSY